VVFRQHPWQNKLYLSHRSKFTEVGPSVRFVTGTLLAVKQLNPRDKIMKDGASHVIVAWIKRDVPTIIATGIACAGFKLFLALPPIIFHVVVGVISGFLGLFVETAAPLLGSKLPQET
jgi:hypothetical protein